MLVHYKDILVCPTQLERYKGSLMLMTEKGSILLLYTILFLSFIKWIAQVVLHIYISVRETH